MNKYDALFIKIFDEDINQLFSNKKKLNREVDNSFMSKAQNFNACVGIEFQIKKIISIETTVTT